jgi:Subtilase family
MRMNQMKTSITLLACAAFLTLAGCSARTVVKAANPNLDPAPVAEGSIKKQAGIDPLAAQQWNIDKVGASALSGKANAGSRRVVTAILGTGVDYTHEDLAQNILVNRAEWRENAVEQTPADGKDDDGNGYVDDFVGYDFVENDGFAYDRNGTGTAMAGIVAAVAGNSVGIRGVAPSVSVLPVRFIDGSGSFFLPHLVQALKYALAQRVDVIVLHTPSYVFGAMEQQGDKAEAAKIERGTLVEILSKIEQAGIPVVASAGNSASVVEGSDTVLSALKDFKNVVVVTSLDQADKRPFIANYSMRTVHTSAPGAKILTTQPGNRYEVMNGTALAAAHVGGALALAISAHYGKLPTTTFIQSLLKDKASDVVAGSQFETMGGNRLNVQKYLTYIDSL